MVVFVAVIVARPVIGIDDIVRNVADSIVAVGYNWQQTIPGIVVVAVVVAFEPFENNYCNGLYNRCKIICI